MIRSLRWLPRRRTPPTAIQTVWIEGPGDVVTFGEFVAVCRRRIERTSGRPEVVYHLDLPNARQVLLRHHVRAQPLPVDRAHAALSTKLALEGVGPVDPVGAARVSQAVQDLPAGGDFWVVAEVPADSSRAAVLPEAEVVGELRRIADRPPRQRVALEFLE